MATGGFPKEPRQLMINMMYLVLTALLALNVSAEILNAFHVVNRGIENSNIAAESKASKSMEIFATEMKNQGQDKVGPYMTKANQAVTLVDAFTKKIDDYKAQLVAGSGGWTGNDGVRHKDGTWAPDKGNLFDDRNLDVSTRVMVEKGGAAELEKLINDTRTALLALVADKPDIKAKLEVEMPLKVDPPIRNSEGQLKDWVHTNFEMVPTIAALTLLNKFQNDAQNSEGQILDELLKAINATDQTFDKLAAKVIAPTSYIMQGTEYKADIFVAAYNSTSNPTVTLGPLNANAVKDENGNYKETKDNPVNGGTIVPVDGGMAHYKTTGGGEGLQHYTGAIQVVGRDGSPLYYPFEGEYMVAKGAAVVSSDNLNLIYAGIPNPFSVSVPGFPADKVNASSSAGSFTKAGSGKFTASMGSDLIGKEVTINVSVQLEDGSSRTIGSPKFVVKRIPDPIAAINGTITEGDIQTGTLRATPGIGAILKDFYFQGVRFDVTSFECVYVPKRQDPKIIQNSGAKWNSQIAGFLAGCKPGDQIIFRKIKAVGPDKTPRSLNSIPLQIK